MAKFVLAMVGGLLSAVSVYRVLADEPVVAKLNRAANVTRAAGPFDAAIAKAQARTVKLYGGKIGREPGYASGVIIAADGQILTASGPLLSGEETRVVLANGR